MLGTLDHLQLFDEAESLVAMMTECEVTSRYQESRRIVEADEEAQQLIKTFTKIKERYDEVQRFGKYHPDYKTVINEMMEIKRELDMNDIISAYKKAEEDMENLLNEISGLLAGAVSPSIKVPNGDPFFDRGCGGGCGTGGGCSCHV